MPIAYDQCATRVPISEMLAAELSTSWIHTPGASAQQKFQPHFLEWADENLYGHWGCQTFERSEPFWHGADRYTVIAVKYEFWFESLTDATLFKARWF